MDFTSLRAKYQGYADSEILSALQATKYPDYSIEEIKQAVGYKPPKRSFFAVANDTVIEAANAAAGFVKSAGDFVAPGNAASRFIDDNIIKAGEANQSDAVKEEKARYAREMQQAQGIGDEVSATLGYAARNPGLAAAQAVGSFAGPGLAVKGVGAVAARLAPEALVAAAAAGDASAIAQLATLETRAGLAGGSLAGAAGAGGDAAGTAYELVIRAGGTDAEATEAARKASVIPAIIGGAGGVIGAEKLLAGGKGFTGGLFARAAKTGAVEGIQEGVEEGVTQYEGQRAAVPYDPTIDPTKGVAGAATMGAVLGGGTGAGVAMFSKERGRTDKFNAGMDKIANATSVSEMVEGMQSANDPMDIAPLPTGLDAEGAIARMEQRLADDYKTTRAVGRSKSYGEQTQPVAADPLSGFTRPGEGAAADASIQEVEQEPFNDRILTLRGHIEQSRVRQQVRDTLGADALNDLLYYVGKADDAGLPGKTSDRMLQLAEQILSRAQAQPISNKPGVGKSQTAERPQLGANQPLPQIGLDTTPTGVLRADAAGNVAPEVRADRISLQDRARAMREQRDGLTAQAPRPKRGFTVVGDGVMQSASWVDVKRELGLPANATQADVLHAAAQQDVKRIAWNKPSGEGQTIAVPQTVEATNSGSQTTHEASPPAEGAPTTNGVANEGQEEKGLLKAPAPIVFANTEGQAGNSPARSGQDQEGTPAVWPAASRATPEVSTHAVGDRFTLDGKRYTLAKVGKTSFTLKDAKGKTRIVSADSKAWKAAKPAASPITTPQGKKHPRTVWGSDLLAIVSHQLGGIDPMWRSEFSSKMETARMGKDGRKVTQWRDPLIPGVGRFFRAGGAQDFQRLAEVLEGAGYLAPGSVEADYKEAGERAKDMVKAALQRSEPQTLDQQITQTQANDEANRLDWEHEQETRRLNDEEERLEREAIMAENGLVPDSMFLLEDGDLSAFQPGEVMTDEAVAEHLRNIDAQQSKEQEREAADDTEREDGAAQRDVQQVGGNEPARPGSVVGDRAPDAGPEAQDILTAQTAEDLKAKAEREAAGVEAERKKKAAEQEQLRKAADAKENKARADATVDDFQLGQDATRQMSGMADMFADDGKVETSPQPVQKAEKTGQEAPATQAAAILDAAAEPPKGAERLSVIKDVKAGAITPDEVKAAYPAKDGAKPERLTDAGEELIRNRRGKLKGLAWDDVSAMNDTLKVAQVVKANVWPRPDYAKMVEDGAPAWKAAALKAVYDKLAAAPVTRTAPTDADLRAYIETMQQVRDTLLAELDRVAALPDGAELWKSLKAANVFGKVFPIPLDARPVYGSPSAFDRVSEQGKSNNKRALLIGGNGAVQALQFNYKALSKVKDLLAEGFPAKQEAWQKSYEVRQTETRDNDVPEAERTGQPQQRFYAYEKGSRWRLARGGQDGGYATQEQAEAFARGLVAKPKKEVLPPSRGLDLADVTRTGPDWRDGKDVAAQDIMDRFGFRGVNLGEYVKAKQGMAQLHLNHVFDAFSDLADLLGVPPKAMSLNGTLGVAIGAQGSGKALAHFVPGVNEINITRDSGAGALAHEFGHAMDHYFATQHGRAVSMAKRPYLSAVVESMRDAGDVRPEVMDAMRAVMKTLNARPMTEAEARKYMADQRALNQRRMDGWVQEFSGNKGADPTALKAVAETLKRGDIGEAQDADVEVNLAEFMRAAGLNPGNAIAGNAFAVAYRLRDLADEQRFMASHVPQVATDYAKASAAMDAKKQGDGYWSTPWEKFARAFETFAMDALKDRERESLYLSGLVDSAGWNSWAATTGKAAPYPAGAERLDMQQAFQRLVDTIQTTEDAAGNVALFNTSEGGYTAPDGSRFDTDSSAEAARNIGLLDRGVGRGADSVHPYVGRVLPGDAPLGRIAAAFGGRIQWFDLRDNLDATQRRTYGFFNGANIGGTIFLRASGNDRPHLATLGHEAAHRLKREQPDLYNKLVDAIAPYVDVERYEADFAQQPVARNVATAEGIQEEFIGEVLSDGFMDKGFWQALGEKSPSLLKRVGDFVTAMIDKIMAKVGYNRRTERYLSDFNAVMSIAGETMAEFGVEPSAQFSRASQTNSKAFRDWFGESKVVDAEGKPLVVGGFYIKHDRPVSFSDVDSRVSQAFELGAGHRSNKADDNEKWPRSVAYQFKVVLTAEESAAIEASGGASGYDYMMLNERAQFAVQKAYEAGLKGYAKPELKVARRLGRLPSSGRSTNHAQNESENGVSVLGIVDPASAEFKENTDQLSAMFMRDRAEHYVVGYENTVDLGSDGEDLLMAATDLGPVGSQIKSAIGNSGAFDPANGDIRMSRNPGRGVTPTDAEAAIAAIREALPNAPQIVVHEKVANAPKSLRDDIRAAGAENDVEAAYHEGKIHVFPAHIESIERLQFVVAKHEVRHHGLRSILGPKLHPMMMGLYLRNAKVRQLADAQMAAGKAKTKVLAVEEALADMAPEDVAALSGFDRLVAAVRQYLRNTAAKLRKAGLGRVADMIEPNGWTDKDVMALIARAEDVSRSGGANFASAGTVFSRGDSGAPLTAQDLVNSTGGVFDFNRMGETKQDRLRTIIDKARRFWLGALTRDQIADIYGKEVPQIKDYDTLTRALENERSSRAQKADELYQQWSELPGEVNDILAAVMLDATVNQVHPDKATPPAGASTEQLKAHARVRAQYEKLPLEGRAMYAKVRDAHTQTLTDLRSALEGRIDRLMGAGQEKAALLADLRKRFDQYLTGGPYFPLSRFGDYLVVATRDDGERVVSAFESSGEQLAASRALEADGFAVKLKTAKTYQRSQDGAAGKFIGEVLSKIEKADLDEASINGSPTKLKEQLLDDINQLFIRSLPDMSYRKHFAHRKNTPGFSADVMRGFASSAFHSASHIARLNHSDKMAFQLEQAYEALDSAPEGDFNQVSQVLDELSARHEAMLNPQSHPLSTLATQAGFTMYLGLSPAAGLINMLQVPMVALPYIGARHGFAKASAAMGKAYKDIMAAKANAKNGFNAAQSPQLTPDERAVMSTLQDEGVIDLTQAHDLAAATERDIGNQARSRSSFAIARAMKIVGWTFHVPEVMNRQVTALMAYRLEIANGASHEGAIEAAREAIKRTQFDYSASNRARYMQGNVARVVTQFKQFSQNMTYFLGRAAYQALKDEDPDVRRIARRQILATFAVTGAMAGSMGLPGIGFFGTLAGALVGAMGDDDEPWDWKTEYRNLLSDTFGQEVGEVLAKGIPRALMPAWDISGRVGLSDLWWRDSGKEGQNPRESFASDMANILGPTAGSILGWYTAADHMSRGNYGKATEAIVPKFIRDPLKAYREGVDGVTTYAGEPLMDTTGVETLGRILGFAPSRASEMYDGRNAVMNAKTALEEKRQVLLSKVVRARLDGDADEAAELMVEIAGWNGRNPAFKITGMNIAQSRMTKLRNRNNTENGIALPKSKEALRERARFAETE